MQSILRCWVLAVQDKGNTFIENYGGIVVYRKRDLVRKD